ncbi:hypothetical protein MY8738_003535 [Beauveria namnaoensis]
MLAVIDFAAGSYTQAWVKIGLSIRLAQALDLLSEPNPSLLWWAKEERRRTFWSVYLLDRIVTSSSGRSPSILDADCMLSLPVDQATLAPGMAGAERITVMRLLQHPRELGKVGYSGFLCLLASTLGRVQRYCLRRSVSEESPLPWDSQSEFASIYSVLLTCEAYSPTAIADFEAVLEAESFKMAGELNHNSMLVRWQHFPRLARALQDFNPDPAATSSMISPFILTNLPGHPDTDAMWKLLDYGKASQSVTELASTSGQSLSFTI